MKREQVLDCLARARADIEEAATAVAEGVWDRESDTISREILDFRARVDALEARVAVLEARGEH